jgi:translation initiation factor 1 (eIF-1/SUI1)
VTPGPSDERRIRDRVERIRLDRMDALRGREITREEQHQQQRIELERLLSQLRDTAAAGEVGAADEVDLLEQQLEDLIQACPRP